MGKHRFPTASRSNRFKLWSAATDPEGSRVVRHDLSFARGEAMVLSGRAERMRDESHAITGYRERPDKRAKVSRRCHKTVDVIEVETSVLTHVEVEAAIGLHGKSRTAGMTDEQREERVRDGEDAEDFIERATEKRARYAMG